MSTLTHNASGLHWTKKCKVGIARLDRQHRDLFNTFNDLNRALSEGHGGAVMERVLCRLLDYSRVHFATEESLMETHNFPGLPTHRIEHQTFLRKIEQYVEEHKQGKLGAPASLLLFLQSWLKDHVLKADKTYTAFFSERGVF